MKKTINGKSYNTEYDSEFVAQYRERIDGWAHTRYQIFRKKSTGEYFLFSKWSEWNDGWDIRVISEKMAKNVMDHNKKGENFKFCAMMAPFPGERRKGVYFWGTEDDDPWDGKKVQERKEARKKQREETIRKSEEAAKAKEEAGEKTWGVMRITACSEGHKFAKYQDKAVPAEKIGKVKWHKVNLRLEDNDKGNGYNCAYTFKISVILENGDKKQAKDIVTKTIQDVVAEKGEFDPIMKGGHIVDTLPVKNSEMWKEITSRIKKMNEAVVWG